MSTTEALQREAFDKLHPKNDEVPGVLRESFFFLFSKGWEAALAATSAPAERPATPEVEAERFIQAAISNSPKPLQELGRHLSEWLDEDKWATAERLLLAIATSAPSEPAATPIPKGWKLVPMEPSEQMFTSFSQQIETGVVYVGGFVAAYRCMLDAAPQPEPQTVNIVRTAYEQLQREQPEAPAEPVAWPATSIDDLKPIGFAQAMDVLTYVPSMQIGLRLPGVRDVPMYTGDQLQAAVNFERNGSAPPAAEVEERRELSDAARDVLAERARQMSAEGWTPEHDDEHSDGGLAKAAACYALGQTGHAGRGVSHWPWAMEWWKPKDRRRNLIKAGALILAEIERLDRAKSKEKAS